MTLGVALRRAIPSCGLAATLAAAAVPATIAEEEARTEKVTPGPDYGASGFHRLMLGASYRKLWTTPIALPVLDLSKEGGGGLKPAFRVGGQETLGLALVGKDGRSYTFRGVEKNPSNILPEELQNTFVEDLLRDQMAAQHPASEVISAELSQAAGILTMPTRMVVMPDDPALGEFREAFKGLSGTFFEYPTAENAQHSGWNGALEIVDHMALFAKLTAGPDTRVAIREFLRARLFDVFVSDFDRHRKQWRWLRRAQDPLWHPIPEDRDQAFARYDGLIVRAAAGFVPQIRDFGEGYDPIFGLTYNGREQDRWLLPQLSRDDWHAEAKALQAALTDEVIERAARRMPPEWYPIDGARLVAALQKRRDALVKEADVFYEHLAHQVDVQATDASELARVKRQADGSVEVEIARIGAGGAAEAPYFHRRFLKRETSEIRLYLRGGDDRVEVDGPSGGVGVGIRVIGGDGNDVIDARSGGTHYYDSLGHDKLEGAGAEWDKRPYTTPPGPESAPWIPPRDWGRDYFGIPWLSYGSDEGLFLGAGVTTVGYGFRKHPWADQQTLRAGWAFGAQQPKVDYKGTFHRVNSDVSLGLHVFYSGLEVLRYFGYGNDTASDQPEDFYKVRQKQIVFTPTLTFPLVGKLDLTLAPALQYSKTEDGDFLVTEQKPYGYGNFGQLGGWARLSLDTRRGIIRADGKKSDLPEIFGAAGYPVSGVHVEATGTAVAKAWDVESSYGWVEGRAAGFWSAGSEGRLTLAVRAGSKHMFGKYPFFNAASIGGGNFFSGLDAVRGLRPRRYIGDTSLYGNAEVRLYISRFFLALPGEWGLFGFADAGRVWFEGETSDAWHDGYGGGVWIGLLSRANSIAFTVANSENRTALYIRAGFSF